MGVDSHNFVPQGRSKEAQDAEDIAAALLLREVENYLQAGQPRHAIAHIVEATGVSREQAEGFVAEYQNGLLSKAH